MKRLLATPFGKKLQRTIVSVMKFLEEMDARGVAMSAAAVAYFTLLAVFPAIAATMAIGLYIIEPSQIQSAMAALGVYMPKEITELLTTSLGRQAAQQGSNLLIAILGVALALYGASGAMQGVIKALNRLYGCKETRNPIALQLRSVALTVGVIVFSAISAFLLICSSERLAAWGVAPVIATTLAVVRWLVIALVVHTMVSLLFHFAPNHTRKHGYMSKGTIVGALLWLGVTVLFMTYVQYFASFAQSYSVFAGIIALMMWFNLGTTAILVGALLDVKR